MPCDRRRSEFLVVQESYEVREFGDRKCGDAAFAKPFEKPLHVPPVRQDRVFGQVTFGAEVIRKRFRPAARTIFAIEWLGLESSKFAFLFLHWH